MKKKTAKKASPRKKKKTANDVEVFNPPAQLTDPNASLESQVTEAGLVLEACGNDEKVAQFFLVYLKNGRLAGKAYQSIYPHVTEHSARTLGARMLTKVDRVALAEAWNLGLTEYMRQLKEGLNASKKVFKNNNETGEIEEVSEEPDHKTRRDYHRALGEIIGIEQKAPIGGNNAVQVNIGKQINDWVVTKK